MLAPANAPFKGLRPGSGAANCRLKRSFGGGSFAWTTEGTHPAGACDLRNFRGGAPQFVEKLYVVLYYAVSIYIVLFYVVKLYIGERSLVEFCGGIGHRWGSRKRSRLILLECLVRSFSESCRTSTWSSVLRLRLGDDV